MIDDAIHTLPILSVSRFCALFGVSRSWYYARYGGSAPAQEIALRDAIERLVLDFPGYGYRRVTKQLQRAGWIVNHKRVLRVMREELLLCQLTKRFVVTTNSQHPHPTDPNLLTHRTLDRVNQAWVADLTSIRLPTTFVYLAAILDAYSRRCIGWALSRWIDTRLTLAALERKRMSGSTWPRSTCKTPPKRRTRRPVPSQVLTERPGIAFPCETLNPTRGGAYYAHELRPPV